MRSLRSKPTARWLVVLAAMGILSACTSASTASSGRFPRSSSPSAAPYSLYTHCGIKEALVDGTYFAADTPLSDGNGNPPAGWDNPYQQGNITLLSPSVAVFQDVRGHVVQFHARPGATAFMQTCT